jgi:hypothetical protein
LDRLENRQEDLVQWVGSAGTYLEPGTAIFEANLLTETAATLWVMVDMSMLIWPDEPDRRSPELALGLGLVTSWCVQPFVFRFSCWSSSRCGRK